MGPVFYYLCFKPVSKNKDGRNPNDPLRSKNNTIKNQTMRRQNFIRQHFIFYLNDNRGFFPRKLLSAAADLTRLFLLPAAASLGTAQEFRDLIGQ